MLRSLLTASSGMKAQQMQVDTIANNIANANTTGFKKNRLSFQSLYYQTYRNQGATQGGGAVDATGLQVGSGTEVSGSAMLMEQGQIEQTNNSLDLAIQGNGFFEVTMPNGDTRYTRDGAFRRDVDGKLVTADGAYLSPEVVLPPQVTNLTVAPDGQVSYQDDSGANVPLTQILLVRFPNQTGLRAEGGNLLAATESSGQPAPTSPVKTERAPSNRAPWSARMSPPWKSWWA